MISTEQIKRGLAAYIDNEILPNIPSGSLKKVLVGTALTLYITNIEKIIKGQDNAFISAMGLIDESGTVDMDRLSEALKRNIPESGTTISINALGMNIGSMILHRSDVDAIHRYILNS